jgi:hypothetical protein
MLQYGEQPKRVMVAHSMPTVGMYDGEKRRRKRMQGGAARGGARRAYQAERQLLGSTCYGSGD